MGICKFCGQEIKLIYAHIIPRNFYLERKKIDILPFAVNLSF